MSTASLPRTVLVTGSAKRLGREIALALAATGWRVAVHYRGSRDAALATVADCERLTPGAAAFAADLGDEVAVRSLLPHIISQLGAVDAVVEVAALPTLAQSWAEQLAAQSPTSMAGIKTSLAFLLGSGSDSEAQVRSAYDAAFTGVDFKEGAAAFLQRRPPRF